MTLARNALAALRPPQRALWPNDDGTINRPWGEDLPTALQRRRSRTNGDISATYSSVFAAVRKRSQMAAKATLHLMRKQGSEAVEIDSHPALDALARVNESLTAKQGFGLIEQHKLTYGKAFWVKRRNRLGVVVEFEIWAPETVEVVPRKDKPWTVAEFKRYKDWTTVERVAPEDVVWFRHFINPANILDAMSPIGAVRVQVDTGTEALRFNQRFFDNDAMPAALLSAKDAGKGEIERIKQDLEREFKGTDNKHRLYVTEGDLTIAAMPIAHKDMQFLEQMQWNREEVATVFEMSPVLIGDTSQATKENLEGYELSLWMVMINQVENTCEELNEFFIRPDFGDEYFLTATFDGVQILQADAKRQAEIDEINLRSGKSYINELKLRDGEAAVPWGDEPLLPQNVKPLSYEPPAKPAPIIAPPVDMNEPRAMIHVPYLRSLTDAEDDLRRGWERRLQRELRAFLAHLDAADGRQRALSVDDVGTYEWDWWLRYGEQVMQELAAAYQAGLITESFVETPLLPTHELAVRFAQRRAAELLQLDGRENVVALTRERMREIIEEAVRNGESIRTTKNKIRQDFAFSDSRAETIARTETAMAHGDASLKAYSSNGYEGKQWLVDGDPCPTCVANAGDGPISLTAAFSSGDMTVPAHPRCMCTIIPVVEMPRRTLRMLVKDAEGKTVGVEEITSRA